MCECALCKGVICKGAACTGAVRLLLAEPWPPSPLPAEPPGKCFPWPGHFISRWRGGLRGLGSHGGRGEGCRIRAAAVSGLSLQRAVIFCAAAKPSLYFSRLFFLLREKKTNPSCSLKNKFYINFALAPACSLQGAVPL